MIVEEGFSHFQTEYGLILDEPDLQSVPIDAIPKTRNSIHLVSLRQLNGKLAILKTYTKEDDPRLMDEDLVAKARNEQKILDFLFSQNIKDFHLPQILNAGKDLVDSSGNPVNLISFMRGYRPMIFETEALNFEITYQKPPFLTAMMYFSLKRLHEQKVLHKDINLNNLGFIELTEGKFKPAMLDFENSVIIDNDPRKLAFSSSTELYKLTDLLITSLELDSNGEDYLRKVSNQYYGSPPSW